MRTNESERNPTNETTPHNIKSTLSKPTLSVDVDYYQNIIDDPEVSEERKRELIEIVGAIVMNFIDIGFGVHPVQLAQDEQQKSTKEKASERNIS